MRRPHKLPEPPPADAPDPEADERSHVHRRGLAQEIWRQTVDVRSCRPVVLYLARRGLLRTYGKRLIDARFLGNLRAHSACPYKGGAAPALIAPVNDRGTGLVTAIWRILLKPTGEKIERRGLAPMKGCASRLFWPEGDELAVAEGVEDALAFYQLAGMPTWAALSAGNMAELTLPDFIRRVVIVADNDGPDAKGRRAGPDAARHLARRLLAEGRIAEIVKPQANKDANAVLLSRGIAR